MLLSVWKLVAAELRTNGLLLLCCIFQMDTTQESYLDLFPLDAIVYLTPDSENGKYFICFKHREPRHRIDFFFLSFYFRNISCIVFQALVVSSCMRYTVSLDLMLSLLQFQSVLAQDEVLKQCCFDLQQT